MRLLHENEVDFILDLIEEGKEKEIDLEASERGPFLTPYMVQRTLDELSRLNLIEIESVRIDYVKGHFLDGFLASYTKLIQAGKLEEAKAFAIQGDFSALNDAMGEVKTIPEIWSKRNAILEGKGYLIEADFDKDLYDSVFVKLKVKKELSIYLDSYLEAYKNDKLEKPESPKDKWERIKYFENEYFRYKKQREIFINLLIEKVDIQNPQLIKIEYRKELPLEHINLTELLLCLEKEGIIKESKFETVYNGKDIEDFGGRNELWLSVDEDKIKQFSVITKSVGSTISTPFLLKEGKSGYFKFYKQGPKILLGNISSRKYRLFACLIDPLGVAKNIDAVFEAIRVKKDQNDSRLNDTYLADARKIELIQFTLKELQKIKGLKGKITLDIYNTNRTIALKLNP